MICKQDGCNNEARAKSPFCGGTCKKRHQRQVGQASGTKSAPSGTNVPVEVGQSPSGTQVGQAEIIKDETVYNRPAIRCSQYGSRPMPTSKDDKPHPGGRGKFTRADGSEYQFGTNGNSFELTNGKAYQTTKDVRACYA